MENQFKKLNKDNIIILSLSLVCFIFILAYMFLQKGIADLSLVLCYAIAIVLPMYNILNKNNDEEEIVPDYLIASISSICIIIYICFSLFSNNI